MGANNGDNREGKGENKVTTNYSHCDDKESEGGKIIITSFELEKLSEKGKCFVAGSHGGGSS